MMLVNAYFKWPQTTFKKRPPPPTHTLFVYCNSHARWNDIVRGGMSDISASANQTTDHKNIIQVWIFQLQAEAQPALCIQSTVFVCVEFHQASEEGYES